MTKLTETQIIVLSSACRNEDGLASRPENLKTAAAEKLAASLQSKGFAREIRAKSGAPIWREDDQGKTYSLKILKAGRDAVGVRDEGGDTTEVAQPNPEAKPNSTVRATGDETISAQAGPGPRAGSKQALVVMLLQRPEGAALEDLIAATGWLAHTTRAALTGLRKRGYSVVRIKGEVGKTIYRIAAQAEGQGTKSVAASPAVVSTQDGSKTKRAA